MPGTASETFLDGTPTNGANPWIDSLVNGGVWRDTFGLPSSGGPVTISYALQVGFDPYGFFPGYARSWNFEESNAAASALSAWEAVANVDFVAASSSQSDVWIWSLYNSQISDGYAGYSDSPWFSYGEPLYTVFNNQSTTWVSSGLAQGGYAFTTLVHEFGHLLGLAHPHDGGYDYEWNVFPGVTAALGDYGDYDLNQGIFTVMSYNDGWATQYPSHAAINYGWTATPMALDIAAIQLLYGANTTYASGNDTYRLATVNGSGTFWSCIWDTGGVDVISNAGSSLASIINLNAAPLTGPNAGGYVSYAPSIIGGFTIANGVLIENATGGNANDTLIGNTANNLLTGNAGVDSLSGGAGNDTLDGGAGADMMIGGDGNDRFLIDSASDQVIEIAGGGADTIVSLVSMTIPTNIEALILGDGASALDLIGGSSNDVLVGNGLSNSLSGGAGNDTLDGGAGDDTLLGGAGTDYLSGGEGNDVILAGTTSLADVYALFAS
ncbi:MAG: M10 family metallopeptidase C-terminal domain-containing protein [Acetobacteraceae bacterium]|nr:M10 family metallopeptidase C-terminal domain-containing protein [Acetobacteraceae bacterium]